MKTLVLKHLFHKNEQQIALIFEKDSELISLAKQVGARWSQTNVCW
jgi:hypothetical protein